MRTSRDGSLEPVRFIKAFAEATGYLPSPSKGQVVALHGANGPLLPAEPAEMPDAHWLQKHK